MLTLRTPEPSPQLFKAPDRTTDATRSSRAASSDPRAIRKNGAAAEEPDYVAELPVGGLNKRRQILLQTEALPEIDDEEKLFVPLVVIAAREPDTAKQLSATVPRKVTEAQPPSPHHAGLAAPVISSDVSTSQDRLKEMSDVPPVLFKAEKAGNELPQSQSPDSRRTASEAVISLPERALIAATAFIPNVNLSGGEGNRPAGVQAAGSNGLPGARDGLVVPDPVVATLAAKFTLLVRPRDGQFAVTTLATRSDTWPGTEGLLSGKIVHTAYLPVDLPRKWILQYAAPESKPQADATQAQIINIGGNGAVSAPWPYVIYRPDEVFAPDRSYVVVHGFVRSSGALDEITIKPDEPLGWKDSLMNLLKRWQFRPATRAGKPVDVEVLLIIPQADENR